MAQNTAILKQGSDGEWTVETSSGENLTQAAGSTVEWQCKDAIGYNLSFVFDTVIIDDPTTLSDWTPTGTDFMGSAVLLPTKELPPEPLGGYYYDILINGKPAGGPADSEATTRRRPRIRVSGGHDGEDAKRKAP